MDESNVAGIATYQSAERVIALLSSFDDSRTELGVTEMARSLGVHKSTASRLAMALERAGFLSRHGRRYRLGIEIMRLGTLALRSFDIATAMKPAMEKLAQQTGETVNLAVPDGCDVLNVAEVPSSFILSASGGWTGRRTKAHAAANGKVLLAFGALPIPQALERYTDHTITSEEALAAELEAVRRDGYAKAVAELEEGLVAVAAPVFDPAGACVAALSVSGPAYRMRTEMINELGTLCAAAPSITAPARPAGLRPPRSTGRASARAGGLGPALPAGLAPTHPGGLASARGGGLAPAPPGGTAQEASTG